MAKSCDRLSMAVAAYTAGQGFLAGCQAGCRRVDGFRILMPCRIAKFCHFVFHPAYLADLPDFHRLCAGCGNHFIFIVVFSGCRSSHFCFAMGTSFPFIGCCYGTVIGCHLICPAVAFLGNYSIVKLMSVRCDFHSFIAWRTLCVRDRWVAYGTIAIF